MGKMGGVGCCWFEARGFCLFRQQGSPVRVPAVQGVPGEDSSGVRPLRVIHAALPQPPAGCTPAGSRSVLSASLASVAQELAFSPALSVSPLCRNVMTTPRPSFQDARRPCQEQRVRRDFRHIKLNGRGRTYFPIARLCAAGALETQPLKISPQGFTPRTH